MYISGNARIVGAGGRPSAEAAALRKRIDEEDFFETGFQWVTIDPEQMMQLRKVEMESFSRK